MTKPHIALFGLGLMGTGMARSLLRAGFPLTVYNRTKEKADALAAEGAKSTVTPKEAATGAEVLISMVADDSASRSVWLGEQGALAGVKRGSVLIECSTVTVGWIKDLGAAAQKAGCEFLDAPVTGSRVHAAAGELLFLVGGEAGTLERAQPVLKAMSKTIVHLGPQGSGALMKLINNFVCGVQVASLAEAVAVIERSELNQEQAGQVLGNGAPGSPLVKTVFARMAGRNYDPHFHLALMAKDLTYSLQEGERHGLRLETVAAALDYFKQAIRDGYGEKDFSSVVESLRTGSD